MLERSGNSLRSGLFQNTLLAIDARYAMSLVSLMIISVAA